ncbi:initiation factor 2B-related [Kipferlia bialata]|uniref:Initiation factor 2B-related n=1 Tax=Kipferlia bialata TaxID=797122 RepID=A0A9K3CPX8_9EUKA|nr:initiation factor 2B-related [Kipferlia bialata]|eukprot:g919.t1
MAFSLATILAWQNKRFEVVIAHASSAHDRTLVRSVQRIREAAKEAGHAEFQVSVIHDASVASIMSRIDMVLVGAESVAENGGIINRVGSFQVSLIAKAFNKPVYVAVESYKFARTFPLSQLDVVQRREIGTFPDAIEMDKSVNKIRPTSDYTPPEYISLLFTDLGVFTPAAVSDELMKLYS